MDLHRLERDEPLSLTDMLHIPEKLKPMVADYKMNLVQEIAAIQKIVEEIQSEE